MITYFSH